MLLGSSALAQSIEHLNNLETKDAAFWRSLKNDTTYWKNNLSAEQYKICRGAGTELSCSGKYYESKEVGSYLCSSCGQELFKSDTKFDSGTGWPSFFEAVSPDAVELIPDNSFGLQRTEVRCSRCGAHLGHLFDDGPKPSGKRYCINSVCLLFK